MSQRGTSRRIVGLFILGTSPVFAQETIDEVTTIPETEQVSVADDLVQDNAAETGTPDIPAVDERSLDGMVEDENLLSMPDILDELPDEELLRREFERYRELVNDNILDEADSVAKRVIELSIRIHGAESVETARALTNLAIVQQKNEQFVAAQQNFESAIDILEEREDRLNKMLINPLKGLGASQLGAGRPDLAAQTFGRAVHITHVNEGPHNMEQIPLLESLAETNLRLGLVEDAKRVHDTVYALNLRFYQSNPLDLVPSLMRRANWQHRTGYINDERSTYRRIIRIIETSAGKNDRRLIPVLMNLGRSYFYRDLTTDSQINQPTPASGELYFKRALRIARLNAEYDWRLLADTLLGLGDYNLFRMSLVRARSNYEEAWQVLSADEDRLRYRDSALGKPSLLRSSPLPRFAGSASSEDQLNPEVELKQGRIEFEFTVSDRGRVSELKITTAEPGLFTDIRRYLVREMRTRIYRPQYSDDGPIAVEGMTGTHTFYYKQSDLDALELDDEEEDENSANADPEEEAA